MTKEILMNHKGASLAVLVDDDDYPLLSRHSWYVRSTTGHSNPYACTSLPTRDGHRRLVAMHHFIIGIGMVDHKNGNTLDNRKDNLRKATHAQNMANVPKVHRRRGRWCYSKYKGVVKFGSRWRAQLRHNHKTHYFGTFDSEDDAARAFNVGALKLQGEFAWLNPVPDSVK